MRRTATKPSGWKGVAQGASGRMEAIRDLEHLLGEEVVWGLVGTLVFTLSEAGTLGGL